MALSPQMRASIDRRALSPRSRRRRRKTWKVAVLVLAVCGGVAIYLATTTTDDVSATVDTADATSRPLSPNDPVERALKASRAIEPEEPVRMTFGTTSEPVLAVVEPVKQPTATVVTAPLISPPKPTPVIEQPQVMPQPRAGGAAPYDTGMAMLREGKLVEGRAALSALLTDSRSRLSSQDAQLVREMLTQVNKDLVYSSRIVPGDPLVEQYTIQRGDYLSTIAPKYTTTYEFIARVNGINPDRIRLGQKIKIVKGPFHAVVSKKSYRLDLYLPDPSGKMIYIRSYPVGLGQNDSTPIGSWILAKNGKATNPSWTDPRDGKFYAADSPDNPLGGYWMRLEGTDDNTRGKEGYGIHGTDEQDSVGRQQSLGCIRMRDGDIQELFEMLIDGKSTVYVGE
jgi:lipoprotein-anchoring transpeptidase ErfK/SrfK